MPGRESPLKTMADITPSEIRQKLASRTIWLWHYLHADWQWEQSRQWHAERYALAVQEALDLMQSDPEFCYFFDTASEFFSAVEQRLGPRMEELKARVREGRVRLVSGQMANCRPTQVGDETFIRNLQLGREYFASHLPPSDLSLFHSVDIAIGGVQMPQLLSLAGFRYYRAWRPHGPLNALGVPHQFLWEGIDGSRILVTRGSYSGWSGDPPVNNPGASWEEILAWAYESFFHDQLLLDRSPSSNLWMIHGTDDTRPLRNWLADRPDQVQRFIRLWREREPVPIRWCTPLEFSQAVAAQAERLPVRAGVLDGADVGYNIAHHGANGLWARRHLNDRRLVQAEIWAAAACSAGFQAPQQALKDLWFMHCTYQAHAQDHGFQKDWDELVDRAREVKYHATRIQGEALSAIVRAAGGGTNTTRYLFNPLPWAVDADVKIDHACAAAGVNSLQIVDENGQPFAQQALAEFRHPRYAGSLTQAHCLVKLRLPPLGYRRVEIVDSPQASPARPTDPPGDEMEAAGLRLIYRDHALREVIDPPNSHKYSTGDGAPWPNLCFHLLDHQDWLFGGLEIGREPYLPEGGEWLHCGPLLWTHRSWGKLGPYQASVETSLGSRLRELQVTVHLEGYWQQPPLTGFVSLLGEVGAGGSLTVDTPFAVEPRDPDHDLYAHNLPAGKDLGIADMFERLRPGVFWGRSWCDWSHENHGFSLISVDGCTYWYKDPRAVGHLLLRCVELKPKTWETFCPGSLTGSGSHTFQYAFQFHDGNWRQADPQRRSLELRFPPLAVRVDFPGEARLPAVEHSFLSLEGPALLSAYSPGPEAITLRLYEHQGTGGEVRLRFDWPPGSAQAVNFLGQPVDCPLTLDGREVRLEIKPWQIVTFQLGRQS